MQFSDFDNPIYKILSWFVDLMILSLFWVVSCLPLITIGPACCALYHTIHKCLVNGEGYLFREFRTSFIQNMKQGILLFLTLIPIMLFSIFSYYFSSYIGTETTLGTVYLIIAYVFPAFSLCVFLYACGITARFQMKTLEIIRAAFIFTISHLYFALLMLLTMAAAVWSIMQLPLLLFLMPSLICLSYERLIELTFKQNEKKLENTSKKAISEDKSHPQNP
jgi:uncharacterized membrane protein YesL